MERRVLILDRTEVFRKFIFRIDELHLQYERFDGSMSEPLRRLVLQRGDSVAVLPHDPARRVVLLCEQFRPATYENGPGWLLELPAGIVESGESPEVCARREVDEEIGCAVGGLDRIATIYPSPGGSSERIHVFHAEIAVREDASATGGLLVEGEDIRVVAIEVDEAFARAGRGDILDAKSLVALQWLELRLRGQRR